MIKLSLDNVCWNRKPKDRNEIGVISLSVPKNIVNISIEELANNITQPFGKSWCPAIFRDGIRSNDTFVSQQIFGLDIDEGITFEEMMERCNKYNIIPAFVYTTFSSINKNKFRIIFVLEHEVKDKRVRNLVQLALMKLFPEADKSCKDASRLFFGGLELIYNNYDKTINIPELIDSMIAYMYYVDKVNATRNIKDFCKGVGVNMVNGLPNIKIIDEEDKDKTTDNNMSIFEDLVTHPIIYYRSVAQNFKNYSIDFSEETIMKNNDISKSNKTKVKYNISDTKEKRNNLVKRFNWGDLEDNCKLYKEFFNGSHWAYHLELFGIATNLLAIEGGRKKFFEILNQDERYDIKNWEYQCLYIDKKNYTPQRCNNFCPMCGRKLI